MQVPILSGIYADSASSLRTAYPINMEPVPKNSGFSLGFLRPAEGFAVFGIGPGACRGGVLWQNNEYRVMGDKFGRISSSGLFQELGDIGNPPLTNITLDYGFDHLAIAANNNLFLFDGTTFSQNTDSDLGSVLDVVWIDGYYVTTDGEFIVSSELNDPFSISPDKYASSEEDSDAIVGLQRLNGELVVFNRYTIEIFRNVGGTGFPFQVVNGTQAFKGAVSPTAIDHFIGGLAFVGSGRNEALGVYVTRSGAIEVISTSEIEEILADYAIYYDLRNVFCETRRIDRRELLYIHLTTQTLVYDAGASEALGQPVWFILKTNNGRYRGRHFILRQEGWSVADATTGNYGFMNKEVSTHWGEPAPWEFTTPVVFNDSRSMICNEAVLAASIDSNPPDGEVVLSTTQDGKTYSVLEGLPVTSASQPLRWTRLGFFESQVSMRFTGSSDTRIFPSRLDLSVEPLN